VKSGTPTELIETSTEPPDVGCSRGSLRRCDSSLMHAAGTGRRIAHLPVSWWTGRLDHCLAALVCQPIEARVSLPPLVGSLRNTPPTNAE
jgi:hypothetical protein